MAKVDPRKREDRSKLVRMAPTALIVMDNLPALCREVRLERGLTLKQAAAQIGCAHNRLHRYEQGWQSQPFIDMVIAILEWIATPP